MTDVKETLIINKVRHWQPSIFIQIIADSLQFSVDYSLSNLGSLQGRDNIIRV
jgi:hypothetical protein